MNYLQDLVNLIQVKNFLIASQEDMRIKLMPGQSSEIERKITQINKVLLEKSLALDLDKTELSDKKQFSYYSFESTEDLKEVLKKLDSTLAAKEVADKLTKKVPKKIKPISNNEDAAIEK